MCYIKRISTIPALALILSVTTFLYIKTLRISLWKSGTVALSICAVFACINSLSRAVNAVLLMDLQPIQADPWLCLQASIFYNAICWLLTAVFYYPAVHAVKEMVDDENFAQTWYVFWVLPLVFIALNLFMIPRYSGTLYVPDFIALVQRGIPDHGHHSEPECKTPAGKPASIHAAAAI